MSFELKVLASRVFIDSKAVREAHASIQNS